MTVILRCPRCAARSYEMLKAHCYCASCNYKAAITTFIDQSNKSPKPFIWTKTADQILEKVARLATRTVRAHA